VHRLSFAKASFDGPYGRITSGWERKDGKIIVNVTIPANSDAVIVFPVDNPSKINENGSPVKDASGVSFSKEDKNSGKQTGIKRGSGNYTFEFSEK
jgi:alpha-L-rhamnosidase